MLIIITLQDGLMLLGTLEVLTHIEWEQKENMTFNFQHPMMLRN